MLLVGFAFFLQLKKYISFLILLLVKVITVDCVSVVVDISTVDVRNESKCTSTSPTEVQMC